MISTEAGDLTNLELSWMLQACKMEGFPLVAPVSTGGSLPAQPGALGCVTICPLTHQLTGCPLAPYQWEVGVSSPELLV